jgi:hypothetical protein
MQEIEFLEQSKIIKEIKEIFRRPITWYGFVTGVGIFVIGMFMIGFSISSYMYGWLLGFVLSCSMFYLNEFAKKINSKKELSIKKTYWMWVVELLFKGGLVVLVLVPVLIFNESVNHSTNRWVKYNEPISSMMIIINYIIFSIAMTFDKLYTN